MLYRRHCLTKQVDNRSAKKHLQDDGRVGVASGRITGMRYASMAEEKPRMHCFCS